MIESLEEMFKKGYILVPKILFEEHIRVMKGASDTFDAFLLVLTHVNYSTTQCRINGRTFECKRGECMMSQLHWAEIFRWSRSRTRYFFDLMYTKGIIERIPNPYTTHFRIPGYETLTGHQRPSTSKQAEKAKEAFDIFWEKFHEITQKPKRNIGLARREWNKLTLKERELSVKGIDEYYDNLKDIKYCLQAATYLSNKAFLNEYNY